MERAPSRRAAAAQLCIVCDRPTGSGLLLCSRPCLLEARRELDENVAALHQLHGDGDQRSDLTARNGALTAALLSWSP